MLKRLTFIVSVIAFIYFAYLFIMYFTGTEFPTVAGAIHELVMLPLMVAVPIFLLISIVLIIREKFNFRSTSFFSFLLLLAVVAFIVMLMRGYVEIEM